MSGPKLVEIGGGRPPLTNIPAQLRELADAIESGETEAGTAVLFIPRDGEWPRVFQWGTYMSDADMVFAATQIQIQFASYRMERTR